jgi:hypothetical protein
MRCSPEASTPTAGSRKQWYPRAEACPAGIASITSRRARICWSSPYRPFPELQPYAETGPIFLHAKACPRYAATEVLPPILTTSPDFILRGYGSNDRIVYGTGAVTLQEDIVFRAEELLARADVAYVHVRSARNNCYQCRIDQA